jgi:hypothetical protein
MKKLKKPKRGARFVVDVRCDAIIDSEGIRKTEKRALGVTGTLDGPRDYVTASVSADWLCKVTDWTLRSTCRDVLVTRVTMGEKELLGGYEREGTAASRGIGCLLTPGMNLSFLVRWFE